MSTFFLLTPRNLEMRFPNQQKQYFLINGGRTLPTGSLFNVSMCQPTKWNKFKYYCNCPFFRATSNSLIVKNVTVFLNTYIFVHKNCHQRALPSYMKTAAIVSSFRNSVMTTDLEN